MKKEAVDKRLVFLLVLLVIGGIFLVYNQSTFTGLAVLGEYENQTSCEGAGYIWENVTEENCTNVTVPINETYDCEPCLEYEIINVTTNETGDCINWTSCINETSTTTEECVDVVIGGQCVGDICDPDHLNLCLNQTDCTNATGYWYNNICNNETQCIPETCNSLNYECGSISDGCGSNLDCGTCGSGYTCNSGECESSTSEDDDNEEIKSTTIVSRNTCTPSWECGEWQECVDGIKARVCTDVNNCDSAEGMPETSQSCTFTNEEETCSDGIKNQDEEGIDCGGSCDKKCSSVTGSAISPIEAGKKFILEGMFGNLTRGIISVSILVFLIGGSITLFVLSKKKIISIKELIDKVNKKIVSLGNQVTNSSD